MLRFLDWLEAGIFLACSIFSPVDSNPRASQYKAQENRVPVNEVKESLLLSGQGPGCDQKCSNGGWCDSHQMCQCPKGYEGTYCGTAMCFPQCLNNGTCTAPGVCSCPPGFQGLHCEGGKFILSNL